MASSASPALWWVRRDFRLADNPALRSAIDEGEAVLPLFVLDPVLLRSAGEARKAWMLAALHALDADLKDAGGPGLSVLRGKPADRGAAGRPSLRSRHGARQRGLRARTDALGTMRSSRPSPGTTSSSAGSGPRTRWRPAR